MNLQLSYIFALTTIILMITLISRIKHLLMSLLALEGIMLSIILLTSATLSQMGMISNFMPILFLTMGACEATLGLSLMVLMSRLYGSDMLNNLTINKC